MTRNPFDDLPVVYRYTRAQAIADGVLIDLTAWAAETGFKVAVACTAEVWNVYITPPESMKQWGQSERGRAHDVLWQLFVAIKRHKAHAESDEQLQYDVLFQQEPAKSITVMLKAICSPGDNGEPVMTIMLPNQD